MQKTTPENLGKRTECRNRLPASIDIARVRSTRGNLPKTPCHSERVAERNESFNIYACRGQAYLDYMRRESKDPLSLERQPPVKVAEVLNSQITNGNKEEQKVTKRTAEKNRSAVLIFLGATGSVSRVLS